MDLGELEDGQLSDDSDCGIDLYTPLQRPVERVPDHANNFMGDPLPEESDTDDDMPCGKRLRMSAPSSQIPKKYCVWTSNANEITDILTSFGMDTPENDRNVENYPIPKEKLRKNRDVDERKRKVPTGRKFGPLAPIPIPKELEELDVTDLNTIEEVAKQIAEKLNEPNFDLVTRIVLILGKNTAIEYFRKTREIESKGGLLIMNGSRRRTSGGVFIHLIRSDKQIPGSKLVEIFEDPNIVSIKKAHMKLSKLRKRKKGGKIKKQLSNPPPSPEVPDDPQDSLPELPSRADLITRDLISYEGMDFPDFP